MRPTWLIALGLVACNPWNLKDSGSANLDHRTWDAQTPVPATDGLYIRLPHVGGLVRIQSDGTTTPVELDGAVLESLASTPDQTALVAFQTRTVCTDDEEVDDLADCEDPELLKELALISDATVDNAVEVDPHFNAIAFSPSGERAIAFLDVNRTVSLQGVINLTAVAVLDLTTGEVEPVQVGFAAERVLFTPDDTRAVVLSRSKVAVLDLTTSPPTTEVTFPLTLDPDQTVDPVGVELTPDGRYALISVRGSADLYVLDLELHAVNIVSLAREPADMVVDADADRTVLVYGSSASVDIMDHDFFELDTLHLDEPMTRIVEGDTLSLLYNDQGLKDVYRLDLRTNDLVEYRLENPALDLVLAPTEEYAIALTRAEGAGGSGVSGLYDSAPGMEILDLRPDMDDTYPYLLEAPGVGVAFSSDEVSLHALVLQEGIDYLYQLDLYTGQDLEIPLEVPPRAIGSMPDGTFFITQQGAFGRVSFLDPASGEIDVVEGFALESLIDPEVR